MKALALSLLLTVASAVVACQGTLIGQVDCGEIPSGGCIDKGDAVDQCDDRTCSALYSCVGDSAEENAGRWQPMRECPVRIPSDTDASSTVDASTDANQFPGDGGTLPDDLPPGAYGGPGCASLQHPDCALAVGYACRTSCCGCEEFFVCVSGGWESWGVCENDVPTSH